MGASDRTGHSNWCKSKECDYSEPCSFSHEGRGHTYDKFYGYRITILRLESGKGEVSHVVLRGKDKQFGAN